MQYEIQNNEANNDHGDNNKIIIDVREEKAKKTGISARGGTDFFKTIITQRRKISGDSEYKITPKKKQNKMKNKRKTKDERDPRSEGRPTWAARDREFIWTDSLNATEAEPF